MASPWICTFYKLGYSIKYSVFQNLGSVFLFSGVKTVVSGHIIKPQIYSMDFYHKFNLASVCLVGKPFAYNNKLGTGSKKEIYKCMLGTSINQSRRYSTIMWLNPTTDVPFHRQFIGSFTITSPWLLDEIY